MAAPRQIKAKPSPVATQPLTALPARQWTDNNEQELFNITVDAFIDDFDPQSYIEKALIAKMAECIVRLMRIQKTENAMFDLASSESEHINEIVKSLDNGNIDPKLVKTLRAAYLNNLLLDANTINNKTYIINEITSLNLKAISNWSYVEQHMPMTKNYIIDKCTEKNLNICEYINKNDNPHHLTVRFISAGDPLYNDEPLSNKEITKDIDKIKSAALQQYLKELAVALDSELNVQIMVKNLETRSQQVKDAAIPDPQMLTLIQRYRTSSERQFSKSLAELIALQDRRKNI